MKTNQKGFTTYEMLIVIALISILFSVALNGVGFLRETQNNKKDFIEEQLNYGMIEYYGLFGKYPFEYDSVNAISINPSGTNIKLNASSVEFILEELDKYVGYKVENFDTVDKFMAAYDVELIYRDKHVAQLKIENKP